MSAGNPPTAFTGRDAELARFRLLLGRLARGRYEQSLIVSGLRGVGKTVLLLECRELADAAGWIAPDVIEARPDQDVRGLIADQAQEALLHLNRRKELGDRLRQLGALLSGFRIGAASGGVEVSLDLERSAGTGDLQRDLSTLIVELGTEAAGHQTGIVFLIDEMQFLQPAELEAIAAAMHRLSQRTLPIAIVGAGLPQLPGQIAAAKSYAERLFAFLPLGVLDPASAREAIVQAAAAEGVEYLSDAVDRILELTACYPAFLQAYGKETWDVAPRSPITLADVEAAEPIVQRKLDVGFFAVRFDRATPVERRYLAGMASLGAGPYRSAEVAYAAGFASPSRASVAREAVIRKGLAYSPEHGRIAFTVPRFDDFMRRRYPRDGEDSNGGA